MVTKQHAPYERPVPRGSRPIRSLATIAIGLGLVAAAPATEELNEPRSPQRADAQSEELQAGDLMVVDCLLPGKMRRLGRRQRYVTPRRPLRTAAVDCRIRGGEYTAFDRASYGTALKVWLPQAKAGDAEAQYYIGQIHEKGLGLDPDLTSAAEWYQKAAARGHAGAQTSLGYFYEVGLGVAQDRERALNLYRAAAGLAADMVVLEEDEYDRLLAAQTGLAEKLQETGELEGRLDELQRQLREAATASATDDAREQELRRQAAQLEGEIAADRKVVADLRQQVTRLETQLAEAASAPIAPPAAPKSLGFGPYRALVIANGNYQHLEPMPEAVRHADELAAMLERNYGFQVERLTDGTRYSILTALNRLREELNEKHNLVIYYIGHSTRDSRTQRSWWQPVDAEADSPVNWLSTAVLSDHLDVIPAKHVLVVADAAYSGTLTRSGIPRLRQGMSEAARERYIRDMLEKRVRLVMSSAAAGAASADAAFSKALVEVLDANHGVMEASELHRRLSQALASQHSPLPVFAPIRWAGSAGGGDFFFVAR